MPATPFAGPRKYLLSEPVDATGARPLVVMLHGCGQDPEDFAAGTRMAAYAATKGCYVAWPAQSARANRQRCWNWFRPQHQQRDAGEPAAIAAIVADACERHPIDAKRVYVAGLSAGGAMAAVMGAVYPELFAAIGVHSGLAYQAAHSVPTALAAMKGASSDVFFRGPDAACLGVPTIIFHGTNDTTVHPRNSEAILAQWLACRSWDGLSGARMRQESGDANGRRFTRRYLAGPGESTLVEHWSVEGLGHAWSGGDPAGRFTDPAGPDASAEMLRFFLAHSRG